MLTAAVTACNVPSKAVQSDELPPIWPDYTEVTIPVNIAPMNFGPADDFPCTSMNVVVKDRNGKKVFSRNGRTARFPIGKWHRVLEDNAGGSLVFDVAMKSEGKWTRYRSFTMEVSPDPIDYGLTYRLIMPGYQAFGHMGLYERNLHNFHQRTLMDCRMIESNCVNCHVANRANPDQFSFHVRGSHSSTFIHYDDRYEVLNTRTDSTKGFFVYPYWHPSGKYITYSVNATRQSFYTATDKMLEVYDERSDVIVYCPETHKVLRPAALSREDSFETYPSFSADGKTLYFCTSPAGVLPRDYQKMNYSICRIPFDPESGTFGEVDTLISSFRTHKSFSHPRETDDGRYLLLCACDFGTFCLNHPESDLWMYDLATGECGPARGRVNSDGSESYHNWSSNCKWIVFTSRKEDGMYTRLYLCHFDGNGTFDKSFIIPQRNPGKFYYELPYSFNVPDFTSRPVPMDQVKARKQIREDERIGVTLAE